MLNKLFPNTDDHPQVKTPPPIIYLGVFILGVVFHWLFPWHISRCSSCTLLPGIMLLIGSLIIAVWSFVYFRIRKTSLIPYCPTNTLIIDGPFKQTRNPLYLAALFLYLGLSLFFNLAWPLLFSVLQIPAMHYLVILPEEVYLEGKFGDQYREYKKTVPRWL